MNVAGKREEINTLKQKEREKMKGITTSQYLPTVDELPHVEKPWREMQYQKKVDKEGKIIEKEEMHSITSTRWFLAADQREDIEKSLKEAQITLQEMESIFKDATRPREERERAQSVIPMYRKSVKLLEDLLKKDEDEREYHEYLFCSEAQLRVSISYSSDIEKFWELETKKVVQNPLLRDNLQIADFGDAARKAVLETSAFLCFRQGHFFVSVSAVGHPGLAEKVGRLIEEKLIVILLFKPIQVVHEEGIPLISGKRMGVFVAVEAQEKILNSKKYTLVLKVSKGEFLRDEYPIQLNATESVPFDSIPPVKDGGWKKETAEPVKEPEISVCRNFFNLKEHALKKGTKIKFFRFLLKPKNPDYDGCYHFAAHIIDDKRKEMARMIVKKRTKRSGVLHIAVLPVRAGYWSHPNHWIETIDTYGPESLEGFYEHAWADTTYDAFLKSLDKEERKKWDNLGQEEKKWIETAINLGDGKAEYKRSAERMAHFTKGVFPLAEERLTCTIAEAHPRDLKLTLTFTEDLLHLEKVIYAKKSQMQGQPGKLGEGLLISALKSAQSELFNGILKELNVWAEKHPRYQRVVGIVPGNSPGVGGVSFDMGDDGHETVGITWWFYKRAAVVVFDSEAYIMSHELAHTYGALDEYRGWTAMDSVIEEMQTRFLRWLEPINIPMGKDEGEEVTNGFWAAQKRFMGTPENPENSVMGKATDETAWITSRLYKGIMKQFYPEKDVRSPDNER